MYNIEITGLSNVNFYRKTKQQAINIVKYWSAMGYNVRVSHAIEKPERHIPLHELK